MKQFYIIFCILVSLCIIGCNEKSSSLQDTSLPYIIDFEQCISNARNIKISDIADTIELVELKTPEELPVSAIWQFIPFGDYWFINAREGVFKFTNKGEYITTIGRRGQGPGEYPIVFDVSVDKHHKEFVINSYHRVLYYDLDGNYLRMENKSGRMKSAAFSDSILWVTDTGENTDKYMFYGLNEHSDTIFSVPNPYYGIKSKDHGGGYVMMEKGKEFYSYKGDLYLNGPYVNDTIYRLKGNQCTPYAVFDMGKYKQPLEYMPWYNYEAFRKHGGNHFGIPAMCESEQYLFMRAQRMAPSEDGVRFIVYDKQARQGFLANEDKERTITDDILGGPDIWPIWITDDYYVSMISSYSYAKKIKDNNYTLSPELQKVVDGWNYDTNVILMFCRKKK